MEAYARNHKIPVQWAEKGVRKEDYVLPHLRRMVKKNAYGVYFVFKSMEQGSTFRCSVPKFPTQDPNYRILAHQRSRFTHYYFYVREKVLGPMVIRVASFFPFQTTYYLNGHSFMEQELNQRNIGFRKHDNAFLAADNVQQLQAAADRLGPRADSEATGLLDADPGAQVLSEGTLGDESVALLRHQPNRVLPELRL